MAFSADLAAHLREGVTTTCGAWAIVRRDGQIYGFTDHDMNLSFEGIDFIANTGLTAKALMQTTGLSVDNSEAMGALTSAAVTEEDIIAGRFDGAEVRAWLVNWADVEQRVLQFRGEVGQLTRGNGAFEAELRGLTEALNQPQGRVFQTPCSAVLGDGLCRFDLDTPGYAVELPVQVVERQRVFRFEDLSTMDSFDHRWFERGRLEVLSGKAQGLVAVIKNDRLSADGRMVELWDSLQADIGPGDLIRLEAGCDKRVATCRYKFDNFLNFRGFPHMPGEDWLMAVPKQADSNEGGALVTGDTVSDGFGIGGGGNGGDPGFEGPGA
ncbi:DUF2163 domain-containing protein [Halocynthiibacter styelae]|uniref:DUF2163 domain-containing protein n=1 Tax=Halocynthiibacter styelae TaxID=2761955 RepID=A0A8J7IWG9_9RHOB|nr:DUF2163 domain-containing protein [Paenihalocynthiibacter styelae]MBI1494103.1 DUF2163 domain-containing protein [Paenihalocynthiibacter styelae]